LVDFEIQGCNPARFVKKTVDAYGNPALVGEWNWEFSDGYTTTIRNPSRLYTTFMGPHKVCLTAVISEGPSTCCDKVCKEFEICDFISCDPRAAFGYKPNGSGNIDLFDKSVGVGGASACMWYWTIDGTPHPGSTDPAPSITGLVPGLHNVCLRVEFCQPNGQRCAEEWCEDIIVP
jgi:hypothetical protein